MHDIGSLGLEETRKPKSFGLARQVHILVCNTSHIDRVEKPSDLVKGPVLGPFVTLASPENAINIVRGRRVGQTVSGRLECRNTFTSENVERVDGRSAVTVRAKGIRITQQRGIRNPVGQLLGCV